jgi:hypothetical protein
MFHAAEHPSDQAQSVRPAGEPGNALVILGLLAELQRALLPLALESGVELPGLLDGPDAYGRFVDSLPERHRRAALVEFERSEERLKPHYTALRRRHAAKGERP